MFPLVKHPLIFSCVFYNFYQNLTFYYLAFFNKDCYIIISLMENNYYKIFQLIINYILLYHRDLRKTVLILKCRQEINKNSCISSIMWFSNSQFNYKYFCSVSVANWTILKAE